MMQGAEAPFSRDVTLTRMPETRNGCVSFRYSGMPSAGIRSAGFLDSGQNRAGMTEDTGATEG